ncbi:galactose-specific lectin nattectin [Nematolebias whitei]|uniref:galactose-specific lectin nattectin n=1 Tax=Nematolebias whitei TaxID=451745 RepID=UPI00189B58C7|nr:galactose-specific lectin nattectin [Nematolebias whitei]
MSSGLLVLLLLCGLGIGGNIFCDAQIVECPPTWTLYQVYCYQYENTEMTWYDAEQYCVDHDGHLASFHDKDQYDFIRRLIVEATGTNTKCWVGGIKRFPNENTSSPLPEMPVWMWSDGSNFSFTQWANGKPNNLGGHAPCMDINRNGEDYVDDDECVLKNAFVCAKDA